MRALIIDDKLNLDIPLVGIEAIYIFNNLPLPEGYFDLLKSYFSSQNINDLPFYFSRGKPQNFPFENPVYADLSLEESYSHFKNNRNSVEKVSMTDLERLAKKHEL